LKGFLKGWNDMEEFYSYSEIERRWQAIWADRETFKCSEYPDRPKFYCLEMYPYPSGKLHMGHVRNYAIGDAIARFKLMNGFSVMHPMGWDAFGLPAENAAIERGIHPAKWTYENIDYMKKQLKRMGFSYDWNRELATCDVLYYKWEQWLFLKLYEKGLVYQGKKVIMYCPRCATPLSNFEIVMDNSYQSVTEESTVYKYPVKNQQKTFLLAWSTTPWNKLVTPALAVNPKLEYVKVQQGDEFYILAKETLNILDGEYTVAERFIGKQLTDYQFEVHFDFYADQRKADEQIGKVIADEFVTADEGTGIVTLAVYGEDDYRIMQAHNIQLAEHVDDEGKLQSEIKPWAGMDILQANPLINENLAKRGLIYKSEPLTHSVALCHRCSTRLYYAPLPAWFIDVQQLKKELIAQNEKINWQEGKVVVFDDTFEHEVWNNTGETRVVLLIDVIRPFNFPLSFINSAIVNLIGNSSYVREAMKNHELWETNFYTGLKENHQVMLKS